MVPTQSPSVEARPRGSWPRWAASATGKPPCRAVATCFKPADGDASGGCILRLWEVAGQPGPLSIGLNGYGKAVGTDLLERDGKELQIVNDKLTIDLKAHGYSAVRLLR